MFMCLCSSVICLAAGKAKMLNRGENRTRDLGVTSPHALPSELHGLPDFKTVNYDFLVLKLVNITSLYQFNTEQYLVLSMICDMVYLFTL